MPYTLFILSYNYQVNFYGRKITLSFDESVINKAKRYAEENNISLSHLTEFLLNKVTNKSYQSL